jgi:hypothetical protein
MMQTRKCHLNDDCFLSEPETAVEGASRMEVNSMLQIALGGMGREFEVGVVWGDKLLDSSWFF